MLATEILPAPDCLVFAKLHQGIAEDLVTSLSPADCISGTIANNEMLASRVRDNRRALWQVLRHVAGAWNSGSSVGPGSSACDQDFTRRNAIIMKRCALLLSNFDDRTRACLLQSLHITSTRKPPSVASSSVEILLRKAL